MNKIIIKKYLILSNLKKSCVKERILSILFGIWDRRSGLSVVDRVQVSGSGVGDLVRGSGIWFGGRGSGSEVGIWFGGRG